MEVSAARLRKACINCYQKKVRCEYSPELLSCIRCRQHDLDCIVPGENQKTTRSSIRSGLEGLSSRVQHLEDMILFSADSNIDEVSRTFLASNNNDQTSTPSGSGRSSSVSAAGTKSSVVKSYRGATSTWTTLVSHTEANADSQHLEPVQSKAVQLANEERTIMLSENAISFSILKEFPQIDRVDAIEFVKNYALEAPYPILHYDSLMEITERLLDRHTLGRWGQIVCVLMYMAFGASRLRNVESSMLPLSLCGKFVRSAWGLLPQLILDHDLWALKALTLMVHYLQASSMPEPCWALLGAASQIAVSLGFHQSSRKVDAYSSIEMEEGKRAWWLCYVMEKTFASVLGYPSSNNFSRDKLEAALPAPFQPVSGELDQSEQSSTEFSNNDMKAVEFFKDMIQLTILRDQALGVKASDYAEVDKISTLLRSTLRDKLQGDYGTSSDKDLRDSISDLAHYNAIQVISMQISMKTSPRSMLPPDSILSARATLQIIFNTKTAGKTMCLWMWLYYAFTAAVVLFIQSIAKPLHPDNILDIALISDLQNLCALMAPSSDGAKRIMEIAEQMERVAFEVVKRAAKKTASKRSAEEEVAGQRDRSKLQRTTEDFEGSEDQSADITGDGTITGVDEKGDSYGDEDDVIGREILESAPQNFEWDQWDQWLEDIPFELE